MEGWKTIQSSIGSLNIGGNANKLAKGFTSSVQATRERFGQIPVEDLTELPQEYRDLEARVDALRNAHLNLLRITKVFADSSYDYPTQIQESLSEISTSLSHNITSFAATNLKGTALPVPTVTPAGQTLPKTLPHALARAAASSAAALGPNERLGTALNEYSQSWQKIANARLEQDDSITSQFLGPWQNTLNQSLTIAMKARNAVRSSRLELDAAKQALKNAAPARQEQARLEVEHAEDDLVQKTEVAITMMKTVLENPEPLKNLNDLAKAQLVYHSVAAESLSLLQGEIEELTVAAEAEYRKSRGA
jgi:murein L,D-transpeptidase YcbB/YkuD